MKSMKTKRLRILFIGNSHTYYNDMPKMVKRRFDEEGCDCEVTMLAHPGWFLAQHVEEPDVRFNIRFGDYDYVVLQEHAHPFGPEEKFFEAVRTLTSWIREAGSTPVIYMTWAKKTEPEMQQRMTHPSEESGGATRTAGRILKCMRRMDSTLLLPDRILRRSLSGIRSRQISNGRTAGGEIRHLC